MSTAVMQPTAVTPPRHKLLDAILDWVDEHTVAPHRPRDMSKEFAVAVAGAVIAMADKSAQPGNEQRAATLIAEAIASLVAENAGDILATRRRH